MAESSPQKALQKGVSSSADAPQSMSGHMPALDGIRGAAILLVIMAHCGQPPTIKGHADLIFATLAETGWTGVELFFALSGFLITGILLDAKGAENYFSSFYVRRALRILPLSYAPLFVGFILCPLLGKMGLPYMPREFSSLQLWYWFYIGNWASLIGKSSDYLYHFWSLAVEEQYYLVWPWAVLVSNRRTLSRICLALPIVSLLFRLRFLLSGIDAEIMYQVTVSHFDCLALGALGAVLVRDTKGVDWIQMYGRYFIYLALVILEILALVNWGFPSWGWPFVLGPLPLGILFTGVVLLCIPGMRTGSMLRNCFSMAWLRSCGKYSYAMYIFHFPLFSLYSHCVLGPSQNFHSLNSTALIALGVAQFFVFSTISFGLARLSWWFIEGPANNLKSYFKPRISGGAKLPTSA